MPLNKRCDKEAVSDNIRLWLDEKADEAKKSGMSREELHQQAIAVALSTLKRSCGVNYKSKMTPKEIVAAGRKEEARMTTKPAHTDVKKYSLRVHGFGSEDLSKKIEQGIQKSADLCKISPPVCVGNLGVPRSKMPQLEPQPVVLKFLRDIKKDGVSVRKGKMHVGKLKATQRGIDVRKALRMAKEYQQGKFPRIKDQIVVSSDDHVLDGHHRWAALVITDPNETMNVLKVGMPMQALLAKANSYKGAVRKAFGEEAFGLAGPPKIYNPVRVKPTTAQPKRPVHRKAKSGKEQPFIDPDDFSVSARARADVGAGMKEDGMGGFTDLMKAIREDKNKDRDGAVRRTEFDIGVPEAELNDGVRGKLVAFILVNTPAGHKYMLASGGQGIVYGDQRGRAVRCAIEDLGDGELFWLATQKGWKPDVRNTTADPGYRKPVTEEVEEDSEAPFDRGGESLDERRKILSKGDRVRLETSIWDAIKKGGTKAPGVLRVHLTPKLSRIAGVGSRAQEIDLKDVADAMIVRIARELGFLSRTMEHLGGHEFEDMDDDGVLEFLVESGSVVFDERTSRFLAKDLSTGIQQIVYAYAKNAAKVDGVDINATSDVAMTMTPVIISNLVKLLGQKAVDDHIHLSSVILGAVQDAARDVLGISGRPDSTGSNVVDTVTRRLVAYSGGRVARMSKRALKKLRKAKTLNDVGDAFQASA